jgi:hypothetical protein
MKGSVGKQVTASEWKGRNYLKAYSEPANPRTVAQEEKRTWFQEAMDKWNSFTEYQKLAYFYHERWHSLNASPVNAMVKSYMDIKGYGGTYSDPKVGIAKVVDTFSLLPVPDAKITIYLHDGSEEYRHDFTPASGQFQMSACVEDQRYDCLCTKEGYVPHWKLNRTAQGVANVQYNIDRE